MPKILLTNIQSLRSKVDELSIIASTQKIDIICLTETWLTDEIETCMVDIPGYSMVRNDRLNRRGGGTGMYIKDGLCFKSVPAHLNLQIEGTFVDFPALNLSIFCLYLPPQLRAETQQLTLANIDDSVDDFMNEHPNREAIILGDFNDFNIDTLCKDFNLTDTVTKPTRGNNILDHIMISERLKSTYGTSQVSYDAPIGKSDHLTLVLSPVNRKRNFNYLRNVTVFDLRKSQMQCLLSNAQAINWDLVRNTGDDIDQQWDALHACIKALMDMSIPQRNVTITSKDKPWMTPLTKMLINDKWTAFRSNDWAKFQHLKEKVVMEVKKAKTLWAQKVKQSTNSFWKTVKHLSGKENKVQMQNLITEFSTPRNLAEALANTMTEEAESTRETLDFSDYDHDLEDDMWSVDFSEFDVWMHLWELSPNTAAGEDGIPNRIYSALANYIAGPLKAILERSITERRFPKAWKRGIVVPIPKTNPPQLQKMRTVTLLSAPSKILEKVVLRSMRKTIDPFLGKSQHGYRKGLSTTTAVLHIHDAATRIYDDLQNTGLAILSLDFTKAFDKVDHRILLQKVFRLFQPGFGWWLMDYLVSRSFRVRIQGEFSNDHLSSVGVPQGSVLGPVLFSILVADLPPHNTESTFVQYADDVNVIIPLKTPYPREVQQKVDDHMSEVTQWCALNKQKLNVEKTKLMTCMRTRMEEGDVGCISKEKTVKILGVVFNETLTWTNHIAEVVKRSGKGMYILRAVKPYTSNQELHEVYIAVIRSLSDYCCQAFPNLPSKLTKSLQRIEKRAHKIIRDGDISNDCDCDLDGFVKRRERFCRKLFLKILNNKHHPLHERMPHLLPHSKRFQNFTCRTNKRLHSFFPFTTLALNKR